MTHFRSGPKAAWRAGHGTIVAGVLAAAVLSGSSPPASAAETCSAETFEGASYTVCSLDLSTSDLRIFWRDATGAPYRTFAALALALEADGSTLGFAMNGGMYQDDFSPVGLLVIDGKELHAVNKVDLPVDIQPVPNFYKKPNGIFYFGDGKAAITETGRYLKEKPAADFATQSGPMLVIDGAIHPAFIVGSSDRKIRNGVGVSGPTAVHFVISEDTVNFHDFARFFRDELGCDNALFLDGGSAPALYAPELGRDDPPGHGGFGPIVAVVEERP